MSERRITFISSEKCFEIPKLSKFIITGKGDRHFKPNVCLVTLYFFRKVYALENIFLRGCEAIRVINWDEFFFFFMVVANRNASCNWLQLHCSQW